MDGHYVAAWLFFSSSSSSSSSPFHCTEIDIVEISLFAGRSNFDLFYRNSLQNIRKEEDVLRQSEQLGRPESGRMSYFGRFGVQKNRFATK